MRLAQKLMEFTKSDSPNVKRYDLQKPGSSDERFVFMSNVGAIEEMVDMTNASRSYQMQVEVINVAKKIIKSTLRLGK